MKLLPQLDWRLRSERNLVATPQNLVTENAMHIPSLGWCPSIFWGIDPLGIAQGLTSC